MAGFARRLPIVVLGLALALGLALEVHAQGAGAAGQVTGQVENGTADGPPIGAGLPVRLRVVQGGTDRETLETTTEADGRFRFEGLETGPELEYWAEAVYLGVTYPMQEPVRFAEGQTEQAVTLLVYETTNDDSAIVVGSVHMIAESFGEMLRITEIHLFSNSGDRTYVGPGDPGGDSTSATGATSGTLFIPLPEGAVGLAFEQGTEPGRFQEVEGGLADTQPVPPGAEASLAFFSYHLLVDGETVPLERSFAYPVVVLNLLAAQPGLTVRSDQLEARGTQSFQGRQFEFYGTQDVPPNSPLAMEFVLVAQPANDMGTESAPSGGSPAASGGTVSGNQALLRWLGYGLAVLAVVGAIVYPLASRRSTVTSAPVSDLTSNPKARKLLAELAELDESFSAGQIDEASYRRQKEEMYERLRRDLDAA